MQPLLFKMSNMFYRNYAFKIGTGDNSIDFILITHCGS